MSDINTNEHTSQSNNDSSEKVIEEKTTDNVTNNSTVSKIKVPNFTVVRPDGIASNIFDFMRCLFFAISVVVICLTVIFRLVGVEGSSMEDTLSTNEKISDNNLIVC